MLKLIALNYTVMLNVCSQCLNINEKKTFYRDIGSIDISDDSLQSLKNMTLNKYLIYTVFMLFLHCIFEDLMGKWEI